MNQNPPTTHPLAGKTVLLAEDSHARWIFINILETMGVRTLVALNGREAVDLALREPCDLILMDVLMPEMDGYEATRRIRAAEVHGSRFSGSTVFGTADGGVGVGAKNLSPDGVAQHAIYSGAPTHPTVNREPLNREPHIPVIALTSLKRPEDMDRCLRAGMDDFLRKPVTFQSLEAMLLRHLHDSAKGDAGCGDMGAEGSGSVGDAGDVVEISVRNGDGGPSGRVDAEPFLDPGAIPRGDRKRVRDWKALALGYVDDELPGALERAAELARAGEHGQLSRVLHTIKGVAMTYGLPALTRLCNDLKLAAQSGGDVAVRDATRGIPGLLDGLRRAILDVGDP